MTQSFSPNDPTLNRSNEVLWKLEENYTAFDWFKKVIKNTFNYQGRARRKEYWYYILIASIIILIGFTLDGILDTPDTLSGLAGFILFFLPLQ